MSDLYVLEWSQKGSSFHIQPVHSMLRVNRAAYGEDRELNDYHVIHVGTSVECHDIATACRQTIESRRARICSDTEGEPMRPLDKAAILAALAFTLVLWAVALGALLSRCAA